MLKLPRYLDRLFWLKCNFVENGVRGGVLNMMMKHVQHMGMYMLWQVITKVTFVIK